jgi:hypothetical protein
MLPGGQAILILAEGLDISEQIVSFPGHLYPKEQPVIPISRQAGAFSCSGDDEEVVTCLRGLLHDL